MRIPKISESGQLRFGVLLSYGQMALSICLGLLYTPFFLEALGDAEYGLLQTAISAVSMLSLLSLGFNSGYIRYYSEYRVRNDVQAIYRLNGLFLLLFSILGSVVLLCGLGLSFHLEMVFKDGLSPSEYKLARTLTILATVNMATSFPSSVFSNIVSAHERFVFVKLISALGSILTPLVNIGLLLAGFRSVAIQAAALVINLIMFALYVWYVCRILQQRFVFRGFEKGLFVRLFRFTGLIFINLMVDQINNQVDKILLARFCGAAVVAVYAVGHAFPVYFTSFSTAISGVFTPRVHQLVRSTQDNLEQQRVVLTAFFTKVGRIQFLLLALIASGFVFFGQFFLNLWIGPGYEEAYWVAVICMIPSIVPLMQNVGIEIQRAQNLHHYRAYLYGFIAILNLVSSIYLCQIWGAIGAAIGTGVACVIGNGILMDVVYHKKINIDMIFFWKSILCQLRGMIIPFAVGTYIMVYVKINTWLQFLAGVAVYTAVYAVFVWRVSMNAEEKALGQQMFGKIKRRG